MQGLAKAELSEMEVNSVWADWEAWVAAREIQGRISRGIYDGSLRNQRYYKDALL
jgi:hypothetical protein